VLAVAVAVLYYWHFSAGSGGAATASGTSAAPAAGQTMVYINTDTILNNYKMLEDINTDLAGKRENVQKQLLGREGSLRQAMESYQRRAQAGLLTPNQMKEEEGKLQQQQQELLAYRDNVAAGLMEEEKIQNKKFYDALVAYLKEYNKDKNYQFVFGYTPGGGILLAADKLDITQQVLKGLNDQYQAQKDKGQTPAPADKKEESK
jgi:outer membrane protein